MIKRLLRISEFVNVVIHGGVDAIIKHLICTANALMLTLVVVQLHLIIFDSQLVVELLTRHFYTSPLVLRAVSRRRRTRICEVGAAIRLGEDLLTAVKESPRVVCARVGFEDWEPSHPVALTGQHLVGLSAVCVL